MKFWGVRGSIPAPGAHTRRYGGNTPCIEMRAGDELCIFDLGSGARALGDALMQMNGAKAHVFITHYHYDHLQGLPFFTPIFDERSRFDVYGPSRNGVGVREILAGQMVQPYFPVTADSVFRAQVDYHAFEEGQQTRVGEAMVSAIELNHPGGNLGYRIDLGGKSIVYATDVEHGSSLDQRFFDFSRGTDLLIYDSMYTESEYQGTGGRGRKGWGHSTWEAAVQAAVSCNAKQLVLFHHDPARDDDALDAILKEVRRTLPNAVAASEQLEISL